MESKTPFINASLQKNKFSIMMDLGMLIEQAAESFKIWHQLNPKTIDSSSRLLRNL